MSGISVQWILLGALTSSGTLWAKAPTLKERCLRAAKAEGFDRASCQKLAQTASSLESVIRTEKKDKGWNLICPGYAPGQCIPELDMDKDGKLDKVFLLEKQKSRMIAVALQGKPLRFLENSRDANYPFQDDSSLFDLHDLPKWSVESGSNPYYKDHLNPCGVKAKDRFLGVIMSSAYFIMVATDTGFCMIAVGD